MKTFLLLALVGCADNLDPSIDPTGTYDLVSTWTDGTCGFTGTVDRLYEITPTGTLCAVEDPSIVVGTVTCGETLCDMVISQDFWHGLEYSGLWLTLTVSEDGHVDGTGDITVRKNILNLETCSQNMLVTGTHAAYLD